MRRHLIEQIELLMEHVNQDVPNPEFIERHALAIMDLARSLPTPATIPPARMLIVYTQLQESSA
ncbi:MAG: hypothetical protein ACAH95_04920 [Fimbriimonas sp.]